MRDGLGLEQGQVNTDEDLYYEVFDKNPGLVAISDPDTGLHIDVNETWLTVLGYDRADVVGKTVADFGLWQDPEQRSELVSLLVRDGKIQNFEARFQRKDRTICYTLVSGSLITFRGLRRFLLIGQDVSEIRAVQEALRRSHDDLELQVVERTAQLNARIEEYRYTQAALEESEQRFRTFADTASDRYWETDQTHRFSWLSDGARSKETGLPNRIIGKTRWETAFEPTDNEKWDDHRLLLNTHQPFRGFEYEAYRDDGEIVWISTNGDPVFGVEGEFIGYRGSSRNITQRRLAQAEIEKARHVAEKANQAKSDFLAHMSHEFRTPLNAIIGFGQLLEMQVEDNAPMTDVDREYISHIVSSGEHLLSLINNVLDLSKIEAGGLEIETEPTNMMECLIGCRGIMKKQADVAGISFSPLENDLDQVMVQADPLRLRQVVLNLLSNAIKYNQPNGTVSTLCEVRASDGVGRISVRDTGKGIPADFQKTLFDPFTRDPAIRREVDGAGIGLTISRELAQRMGGDIGFDSVEGGGTTFWIDLPLVSS